MVNGCVDHKYICLTDEDRKVASYFKLIHWAIRQLGFKPGRRYATGLDYDDAFQAGCVGLLRAFKKYNPKKPWRNGVKSSFKSYATQCIRWEVFDELERNQWMRPHSEKDPEICLGWSELNHRGVKMDIDACAALERVHLTETEDLVLEMQCAHNIKQIHIARMLKMSEAAVSLTLSAAKEKISAAMY